jgi:outer membrane protein assembly factor BamA
MVQHNHQTVSAVRASMVFLLLYLTPPIAAQTGTDSTQWETLPIFSYDTDAGFGCGVKTVLVDMFGENESFDLVLFNSTNGERWYRFVASFPDIERRQGTVYPLAVDFIIDYDKWISNSFFGIGSGSEFAAREYYTREPLDLSLNVSRGLTRSFVVQTGVRYRSVRNTHLAPNGRLRTLAPSVNRATAVSNSLMMNIRYDSRNSIVSPSAGLVLSGELEHAPVILGANTGFTKASAAVQYYRQVFGRSVAAGRLTVQTVSGRDLPVQTLLSVGGTNTVRGFPQDRFLDRSSAVGNIEWRIPIVWRLGAVLGADAGRVSPSLHRMTFGEWSTNAVAGLRLSMDTFVVRLDIGYSKEMTGVFLNFGELY